MIDEAAFAELCRAHYEASGVKHGGLLSRDILIAPLDPDNAREFPEDVNFELLAAVFEFSDWAQQEALLLPGEFAPVAYMSRCVEGYMASVFNGGHAQFLSRYRWAPEYVRACELGLEAMGCEHQAKVFAELKAFVEAKPERLDRIIAAYEACQPRSEDVAYFDSLLFSGHELEEQVAQQAAWLRNSGRLVFTPLEKLDRKRAALAKLNKRKRERATPKSDELREPNAAVLTIVRELESAAGVPAGIFFQTYLSELNEYEPAAGPIKVRVWRFAGFDHKQKSFVQDVVIVPPLRGRPPQARLYGTRGEARTDILQATYERAR